ncbi:MAG: LuxR C-terminal-related transcriptional regulator [Tannerella sp.]|jgi:DNA-binding NarL/FixJ family response regulator|nr:LuxR C-terminal-related transcriptional regulator [Tannerella sp.]MDR1221528.1 LuxR C-terminal-related transcriptional regulator [Tannerella sp.]
MSNRKKVLIVEPSRIITEGLVKILGESPSLSVLPPLHEVESLNGRLVAGKPDILLLNPTLLPYVKRSALTDMMREYPRMAVVALVYQYVEQATLRLYSGTVDIREPREHIGEILLECSFSLTVAEVPEDNSYELTKRETDVLVLIAKGFMNKEIAERLTISIHTVISHRKNITRKTNIKSVAGLAMYALMNNLIEEGAL